MGNKINYENKDNLELYVDDNISVINEGIAKFKIKGPNEKGGSTEPYKEGAQYDDNEIRNYLIEKFRKEWNRDKENLLVEKMEENEWKKNKIPQIASELGYYKNDIEGIINQLFYKNAYDSYSKNTKDMVDDVSNAILQHIDISDKQKKFFKTSLTSIIEKSLHIILNEGFSVNLNELEKGIMEANAGDSAQFLFLSRAILAGFNCSNVDVRSSRYDAVIDYKGAIYKVQVKGISGKTISFKDRTRGGKGIDHTNERNIGRRITSKDCDIYVAVDKQVGLCYLIPMEDIDSWSDQKIKSVSVDRLSSYLEKWSVIKELHEKRHSDM